ncbi:response regulator transcription factor [Prescottella equi]|uniref:Two component system response regulator n=1 Tax=Rhodococcus hoagii TaxID=43767 RepID=B4F359_RHOHA|nr:response regulator transcription factor [Prescottella equi]ARX59589.1 two component system response regulator [Prescottella equi]ARX60548.1 two component system response regulator [Prescottella equi]ARX60654.1 two component system response regulator [Prescottella equi]QDP08269.1 response regulator transcription factor [Prescottella equi]CAQ30331.1 two component system response regulator [Prescottella equi]
MESIRGVSVLLADHDPALRTATRRAFEQLGIVVNEAGNGDEVLSLARVRKFDLIVLDVDLPGMSGDEICQYRDEQRFPDIPIVLLSSRNGERERIAGLESGADDYILKPVNPRELALRIGRILDRLRIRDGGDRMPQRLPLSDEIIQLYPAARCIYVNGSMVTLTSREFDLLAYFMKNPFVIHSRQDLLERVWKWSYGDLSTVTVHVRRLRKRLGHYSRIETVWGRGYRWIPRPPVQHFSTSGDERLAGPGR